MSTYPLYIMSCYIIMYIPYKQVILFNFYECVMFEVDTIILSSSESDSESDSNNEIQSIKMKTDYVSENDFILLT